MLNLIKCLIISSLLLITSCTSGQLYYTDKHGDRTLACDVEFVGLPSVDKYAVEYALSLCAKSLVKKGHSVKKKHLLEIDTTIPKAACGQIWTHDIAKQKYKQNELSKKEYGYIVANVDLGLAVVNDC